MSYIPSSAMPRAKPFEESGEAERPGRLGRIAEAVKQHPKTAVAVGVAAVGAAAAAATVAAKGRKKSG